MSEKCICGWEAKVNKCLTKVQRDYFRNSRFKNILFYHGSHVIDIDTFDTDNYKCYFSLSKEYAEEMINKDYDEQKVYNVYLNIERPFNLSTRKQLRIFNEDYIPWVKQKDNLVFEPKVKQLGDKIDINNSDYLYEFLKANYEKYRFDGLIVDEGLTYGKFCGINSFLPFFSCQIKAVTNFKPSKSPNMNK